MGTPFSKECNWGFPVEAIHLVDSEEHEPFALRELEFLNRKITVGTMDHPFLLGRAAMLNISERVVWRLNVSPQHCGIIVGFNERTEETGGRILRIVQHDKVDPVSISPAHIRYLFSPRSVCSEALASYVTIGDVRVDFLFVPANAVNGHKDGDHIMAIGLSGTVITIGDEVRVHKKDPDISYSDRVTRLTVEEVHGEPSVAVWLQRGYDGRYAGAIAHIDELVLPQVPNGEQLPEAAE